MKKIKRKKQEIERVKKEVSATQIFYSQRVKIVSILGVSILLILGITSAWLWLRHRGVEASFLLSEAREDRGRGDYREIASRSSFTKTKPLAIFFWARGLFNQGRYAEAIDMYNRFIEQYPGHKLVPAATIGLAYCYEQKGDFGEAGAVFTKVKEEYPDTVWAGEAEEGYNRISEL